MTLEGIHMQRKMFPTKGSSERPMIGMAEFSCGHGKVELQLSEQACARIIELCAEGVVDAARETAGLMIADVIDHDTTQALSSD